MIQVMPPLLGVKHKKTELLFVYIIKVFSAVNFCFVFFFLFNTLASLDIPFWHIFANLIYQTLDNPK